MSALVLLAFIRANKGPILAGVLVLAVLFGVLFIYLKGKSDERAVEAQRSVAARAHTDVVAAAAGASATVQRGVDDAAVASSLVQLKEADDAQPDSAPSAARLAFACQRLRNAGRDLSKIPACARFTQPVKAPAGR